MSSLADQLGSLLPEGWAPEEEEVTVQAGESELGAQAIAVAVVLEETGVDAEALRPELRLAEDLELTGLALWSVVAQIEHEAKVSFADVDVESWVTLGDLLGAVG